MFQCINPDAQNQSIKKASQSKVITVSIAIIMFDSQSFKQLFPIFQYPDNQGLCYLDNAATSQTPKLVINAITDFYSQYNANAHRSSHRLGRQTTDMVEQCRQKTARYFNADGREIVFTSGTTEALNLVAQGLCESLEPGDEIILSEAEHHANLIPWQIQAQRQQLQLKFIPLLQAQAEQPGYQLDIAALDQLITPKTRILSITAASNALGFINDFEQIKIHLKHNPQAGKIRWILDAAQLAAHQKIDVKALDCDFLVCSPHKFYGPTGVGILYGKYSELNAMPPWKTVAK